LLRREIARARLAITKEQLDDLLFWGVIGVILGGRIGYVLFYQTPLLWQNPVEIFKIWHGGMSFHGGLLGMIGAVLWVTRRIGSPFFRVMDHIAAVAPIGICLGRLANFVNGELWGRVTDVPWAILFPTGGEMPRHPSQLYEAATEGVLLFLLLQFLLRRTRILERPGSLSGVFLVGYGVARFACEFFREPDAQLGFVFQGWMSQGQLLSLPVMAFGIFFLMRALLKRHTASPA
jgi:phosphatidylglycerol:prolipoprotein diacylglycerol transferase